MMKTLRGGLAAMLVCAAMTSAASANKGYSRQQQEACQGDAVRLCGPAIPDHARIHSCLKHHRARLSHACRAII